MLCGLGAVQSKFCIVAAKLQWSVGAIGYRCGCNWVCCYVGWGQQAPIWARQPPTTKYWLPSCGLLQWRAVRPDMGTETPKAQPQWPLPIRGIMMCGYGGGSEGSKWQPWTYFTYFHPGWVWCGNQRMQFHKGHESQWV